VASIGPARPDRSADARPRPPRYAPAVAPEPALEPIAHAHATVRVSITDPDGRDPIVHEIPTSEFETTERGVSIRSLFVPWHRVLRYRWEIRQESVPDLGDAPARSRIRVRVDDGTPGGETFTVPADRYEGGPWAVSLLVERHVEPEAGVLVVDKVFVPWGRVVEVERLRAEAPARPDVSQEREPADR